MKIKKISISQGISQNLMRWQKRKRMRIKRTEKWQKRRQYKTISRGKQKHETDRKYEAEEYNMEEIEGRWKLNRSGFSSQTNKRSEVLKQKFYPSIKYILTASIKNIISSSSPTSSPSFSSLPLFSLFNLCELLSELRSWCSGNLRPSTALRILAKNDKRTKWSKIF